MDALWLALGIVLCAGLAYVVLVAWRGLGIAPLAPGPADPARTREEALERFAALRALDTEEYAPASASTLLEPEGEARGTVVFFHGFTNCPSQFHAVGEVLRRRGLRVLVTRQPRHGLTDTLTRALRDLEPDELVAHVDRTLDVAAGFAGPVYALGMSAGAVQAAWAAATRPEVESVVAISPSTAPAGMPVGLVRLSVRFRSALPDIYIWWDPRKKQTRVQSEWEYPGFPLPGFIPVVHLALEMGDRHVVPGHRLARAVLISNPNDHAVSRHAAAWMMRNAFGGHADDARELLVAKELFWGHDFIDPAALHPGNPEQVADVILSAFGLAEDPTAGGLLQPGKRLSA